MEQSVLAAAPDKSPLPSEDIASLRAILTLVDELAGKPRALDDVGDLAALDARHAQAADLVRARYARLAARTASFSAAGVAALVGAPPAAEAARRSASEYLAGEVRHAIGAMTAALR